MKKKVLTILIAMTLSLCILPGTALAYWCPNELDEDNLPTGANVGDNVTFSAGDERNHEITSCNICGGPLYISEPHSFGEYTYDNNATCTKNGTKTATCKCGRSSTIDDPAHPATGVHDWDYDSQVKTAATYEKAGTITVTCKNCPKTYTYEDKDAPILKKTAEANTKTAAGTKLADSDTKAAAGTKLIASNAKSTTGSKTPKTGDASNLALWIALLTVSCGAVTATLASKKRMNNR